MLRTGRGKEASTSGRLMAGAPGKAANGCRSLFIGGTSACSAAFFVWGFAKDMTQKLVIIGNGMAPGRMLEHLLEKAPDLYQVTIFNAEPRVNYDRIMLSPVL